MSDPSDTWVLVKSLETKFGITKEGELRCIHLNGWLRHKELVKAPIYQELTRGTYDEVRALQKINRS